MDLMQFNGIIPRLRVLETKLLDRSKLDRMIEAKTSNEALKVLLEAEYGLNADVKKAEDYEILLSEELEKLYKLMYDMCPVKELINYMSVKYDYHNIKVLLKAKFLDKDFSSMLIPIGIISIEKLKLAIESDDLRDLPKLIREAIEVTIKDFEEHKDPQRIDIILDKYMFKSIEELSNFIKDKFVFKYTQTLIDTNNLKSLLRIKTQNKGREFLNFVFIDGGKISKDTILTLYNDTAENIATKLAYSDYSDIVKTGIESYIESSSANVFEREIEDYLMKMMKEAKYIPFGVEPILAYIYAKETEIKVVRIIMVGKLNNIAPEVIRERLRDIYV